MVVQFHTVLTWSPDEPFTSNTFSVCHTGSNFDSYSFAAGDIQTEKQPYKKSKMSPIFFYLINNEIRKMSEVYTPLPISLTYCLENLSSKVLGESSPCHVKWIRFCSFYYMTIYLSCLIFRFSHHLRLKLHLLSNVINFDIVSNVNFISFKSLPLTTDFEKK